MIDPCPSLEPPSGDVGGDTGGDAPERCGFITQDTRGSLGSLTQIKPASVGKLSTLSQPAG